MQSLQKVMSQLQASLRTGVRDFHLIEAYEQAIERFKSVFYSSPQDMSTEGLLTLMSKASELSCLAVGPSEALQIYQSRRTQQWVLRMRSIVCELGHLLVKFCRKFGHGLQNLNDRTINSVLRLFVSTCHLWLVHQGDGVGTASRDCFTSAQHILQYLATRVDVRAQPATLSLHCMNQIHLMAKEATHSEPDLLCLNKKLEELHDGQLAPQYTQLLVTLLVRMAVQAFKQQSDQQFFKKIKWFIDSHQQSLGQEGRQAYSKLNALLAVDGAQLAEGLQQSWARLYLQLRSGAMSPADVDSKLRQVVRLKGLSSDPFVYLVGQIYHESRTAEHCLALVSSWLRLFLLSEDRNSKALEEVLLTFCALIDEILGAQASPPVYAVLDCARRGLACVAQCLTKKSYAQVSDNCLRVGVKAFLYCAFEATRTESVVEHANSIQELSEAIVGLLSRKHSQNQQLIGQLYGMTAFVLCRAGHTEAASAKFSLFQSLYEKKQPFYLLLQLIVKPQLEFAHADLPSIVVLMEQLEEEQRLFAISFFGRSLPSNFLVLRLLTHHGEELQRLYAKRLLYPFRVFFQEAKDSALLQAGAQQLVLALEKGALANTDFLQDSGAILFVVQKYLQQSPQYSMLLAAFYLTLLAQCSKELLAELRPALRYLGRLQQVLLIAGHLSPAAASLVQPLLCAISLKLRTRQEKGQRAAVDSSEGQLARCLWGKSTLTGGGRVHAFTVFSLCGNKEELAQLIRQQLSSQLLIVYSQVSRQYGAADTTLMVMRRLIRLALAESAELKRGLLPLSVLAYVLEHSPSRDEKRALLVELLSRVDSFPQEEKALLLLTLQRFRTAAPAVFEESLGLLREESLQSLRSQHLI